MPLRAVPPSRSITSEELRASLQSALIKFSAVPLPTPPPSELASLSPNNHWIAFLKPEYSLCAPPEIPDQAKLGQGSFGAAYKVRSSRFPQDPERVLKLISKQAVAHSANAIQHLCAELAISGSLHHPNLNHRVDLFVSESYIFVILEMCVSARPDVLTRIAHFVATKQPSKISEIDNIHQKWIGLAESSGIEDPAGKNQKEFGDFVDSQNLMRVLAIDLRVGGGVSAGETPVGCDLWDYVYTHSASRLPQPVRQVITRQILLGLHHLHFFNIVHRDVKAENVVLGITRKAELKKDEQGNISGVTFVEKFDVKVIDFGLAKYMTEGNMDVISPGAMISKVAAVTSGDTNNLDNNNNNNNNNLNVHHDAISHRRRKSDAAVGFVVCATPGIGTHVASPLEIITQLGRRDKFLTTNKDLKKFDVYGVGFTLFFMSCRRLPFDMPVDPRTVDMKKFMTEQFEKYKVPVFDDAVSAECKEFCLQMMTQNVQERLSIRACLVNSFVNEFVGDSVVTQYYADSSVNLPWCRLLRDIQKVGENGDFDENDNDQSNNNQNQKSVQVNEALAVASVLVAAIDGFNRNNTSSQARDFSTANDVDVDENEEEKNNHNGNNNYGSDADHVVVEDATTTDLQFSVRNQDTNENDAKMLRREPSNTSPTAQHDNNNTTTTTITSSGKKLRAEMKYFRNAEAVRVFSDDGGDDCAAAFPIGGGALYSGNENKDDNNDQSMGAVQLSRVRLKSVTTVATNTMDQCAHSMLLDAMRGLEDYEDEESECCESDSQKNLEQENNVVDDHRNERCEKNSQENQLPADVADDCLQLDESNDTNRPQLLNEDATEKKNSASSSSSPHPSGSEALAGQSHEPNSPINNTTKQKSFCCCCSCCF